MFVQVTVDKDIYEDVDEETYKEIVRKRREEDFIEDDGTQPPESCARARARAVPQRLAIRLPPRPLLSRTAPRPARARSPSMQMVPGTRTSARTTGSGTRTRTRRASTRRAREIRPPPEGRLQQPRAAAEEEATERVSNLFLGGGRGAR